MTEKELKLVRVKENLCMYDKRNPYYDEENGEKSPKQCFCDCCFYGTAWLAEMILKLMREEK